MAYTEKPINFAIWLGLIIVLFILLSFSIVAIVRAYLKRIYAEQTKMHEMEIKHQQSLVRDSILIQENERERIAADLHDDLISRLNSIKFLLYHQRELDIEGIQSSIEESIKLTRHISHDLCPPLIEELPLNELIENLLYPFLEKLKIEIYVTGAVYPAIKKEGKLQIFRIVQEVINNILKHSQAEKVIVQLHFGNLFFFLRINDNGVGYHLTEGSGGLGNKNILLRAEYIHAKVKFKSAPGAGSTILLATLKSNL